MHILQFPSRQLRVYTEFILVPSAFPLGSPTHARIALIRTSAHPYNPPRARTHLSQVDPGHLPGSIMAETRAGNKSKVTVKQIHHGGTETTEKDKGYLSHEARTGRRWRSAWWLCASV